MKYSILNSNKVNDVYCFKCGDLMYLSDHRGQGYCMDCAIHGFSGGSVERVTEEVMAGINHARKSH